jgi:putative MATE family efflux protein
MANRNIALLENEIPAKSIIKLALPMMVGMIAQMVYNMTDTFFIGQTGDPNMVAGISLTMPLFMMSQGIGNIFGIGASSYISRLLGAKRLERARNTNVVSVYTTLAVGVVLTIVLLIFRRPILRLIGTSDITFVYSNDYFSIISGFIAISLVNMTLSSQARAEGATNVSMRGMLLGIVTNIILDPLFILQFGWGVAGAAWATVAGFAVSAVYLCRYFASSRSILSINPRDFKPDAAMYTEILKLGVPAAISNLFMTFSAILSNRVAASYGDFVIAGKGITLRVESICFTLIMALAMGYQPFAGFNYGAKNFKRLKQGLKIAMLYTTSLAVFFLFIFAFFGRSLVGLFINDPPTINAGARFMHAFLFGMPFMGLQMTMMVTFQAMGKAFLATTVSLGRQCLLYLPLLFILNHFLGFEGFMYSQPIADILTALTALMLGLKTLATLKSDDPAAEPHTEEPVAGSA